jgi:hypothetical protein
MVVGLLYDVAATGIQAQLHGADQLASKIAAKRPHVILLHAGDREVRGPLVAEELARLSGTTS